MKQWYHTLQLQTASQRGFPPQAQNDCFWAQAVCPCLLCQGDCDLFSAQTLAIKKITLEMGVGWHVTPIVLQWFPKHLASLWHRINEYFVLFKETLASINLGLIWMHFLTSYTFVSSCLGPALHTSCHVHGIECVGWEETRKIIFLVYTYIQIIIFTQHLFDFSWPHEQTGATVTPHVKVKNLRSRDLGDLVYGISWSNLTQMLGVPLSERISVEGVCYICPASSTLGFGVTSGFGRVSAQDEEQIFPLPSAHSDTSPLNVRDYVWNEGSLN